ncbi:MAG: hypothetical protein KDC67_10490 [Ignavibacteriae bacterium]|nr:hypothetical protein [Ignavibacteriota bacterium]
MKKVLVCLIILIFFGCSSSVSQEVNTKVLTTNISPRNEIFSKMEYDGEQILMVGESVNDENSSLYNTSFNDLKNWVFKNIDVLKGENTAIDYNTENYYFVNKKRGYTSNIYSLNKKNEKTKTLNTIDSTYIKFLHVNEKENFYIIIGNKFKNGSISSHGYKLFKYSERTLLDSMSLNCNVLNPIFKNGFIYFKSSKNQLEKINTLNFQRYTTEIEDVEIIDFQIIDQGNYLVLGKLNNKTVLTEFNNGNWTMDKTFPIEAQNLKGEKIHYYKGFKAILANGIDESLLMGFGGTRYSLFISYSDSDNWKKVELPIDYYIKPNLFYKDEIFIAYSGGGKLTYVDLNKK